MNISILRLLVHAAKFDPSNLFPIFGIVRFSWLLVTSCGLLLGRPSSPWLLGGGGGGSPPPVPEFPGSPGLPGFPEVLGFGLPDRDGVLVSGAFPLVSVPAGWVVVPLMFEAGPSPGVRKK